MWFPAFIFFLLFKGKPVVFPLALLFIRQLEYISCQNYSSLSSFLFLYHLPRWKSIIQWLHLTFFHKAEAKKACNISAFLHELVCFFSFFGGRPRLPFNPVSTSFSWFPLFPCSLHLTFNLILFDFNSMPCAHTFYYPSALFFPYFSGYLFDFQVLRELLRQLYRSVSSSPIFFPLQW